MAFLEAAGLGLLNSGLSWLGSAIQSDAGRKNLDYQMSRYYSPQAQVNNVAAAGLNPAVAFGNNSPVFSSGGQMAMPDAPQFGIGTASLAEIGSYIKSLADAKKSGADTDKALAETDAIKLQNDLVGQFGKQSWCLDLAQKYQNVILAKKTNDIKEQEKAINEFNKAAAAAESETKGIERDMLKKRLENLDVQIKLENELQQEKINTEKSGQTANYAAANASNSVAAVNREQRRLTAALADIEEGAKPDKLESLIAEYKKNKSISDSDAKEAEIRLSRLMSVEDKRSSYFFNEVDNYLEWLKDKVSIFKTK